MAKKPRSGRRQMTEDALDQLFGTNVPEKNTGPDPHDIRNGGAEAAGEDAGGDGRLAHTIRLDADDRARADRLLTALFALTGEQMGLDEAVRVALHACPADADSVARAWAELSGKAQADEGVKNTVAGKKQRK